MDKLSKKVSEYFKFVQDMLKKQHGDKKIFDLEDKERKNFFKQVRELWKNRKK